jgi:hypothetical protein
LGERRGKYKKVLGFSPVVISGFWEYGKINNTKVTNNLYYRIIESKKSGKTKKEQNGQSKGKG